MYEESLLEMFNSLDDTLEDDETSFAVVHLTWRSNEEPDPQWPWTEFFRNWDDLQEQRLMPDHEEFLGHGGTSCEK